MRTPDDTGTDGQRAALTAGLREFADFLEHTPDAHLPERVYVADYQPTHGAMAAKALAMGGEWQRFDAAVCHHMSRTFGPIEYSLFCPADNWQHERVAA